MSVLSQGDSSTTSSAKLADQNMDGILLANTWPWKSGGQTLSCFKHGFSNEKETYACK